MDYPYKYLVVVSESDNYSESEQYHKFVDVADAIKKYDSAKESHFKCAMYRINQHYGFN